MMVDVTYQMVLSTLQTAGILVGIIYYLTIMRNSQKNQQMQLETRQSQLFMQLFQYHIDKDRARIILEIRTARAFEKFNCKVT